MLNKILPALRIHSWGGLGSQLYAWAFLENLRSLNSRKLRLIHHTSGVTARNFDIDFLENFTSVDTVEDFRSALSGKTTRRRTIVTMLRKFAIWILTSTRFVIYVVNASSITRIRFWTLSLRGHYSDLEIPVQVLQTMSNQILHSGIINFEKELTGLMVVHYRLGDLLTLPGKPPLEVEYFKNFNFDSYNEIRVLSDSPNEARRRLGKLLGPGAQYPESISPWEVLEQIINCEIFVGTPSKLSAWGIGLRALINPSKKSYFPTDYSSMLRSFHQTHINDCVEYF